MVEEPKCRHCAKLLHTRKGKWVGPDDHEVCFRSATPGTTDGQPKIAVVHLPMPAIPGPATTGAGT